MLTLIDTFFAKISEKSKIRHFGKIQQHTERAWYLITVTFLYQVGEWSLLAISIIVLDGYTTLCAGMASIFKSHFFENHKNEVSSITTLSGSSTYLY